MAGFAPQAVYRGGLDLTPTRRDVKVDPRDGLLLPTHGISLSSDPAELHHFGGPYEVLQIPDGLMVRQRGRRATHYELMPAYAMSWDLYVELLAEVKLRNPN